MPCIEKFGLLLIELHSVDAVLAAKYVGKTTVTAYDATHGFSDQFIVEFDVFQKVISEIGLENVEKHNSKFPNEELTTVSINFLRGKDFNKN
ncbi:MAG: hypothetical protein JKZ03_03155 [Flavobacteriaceae bacterium]|nr:hypothetical protein [Flavobacteriaceae bacterium]